VPDTVILSNVSTPRKVLRQYECHCRNKPHVLRQYECYWRNKPLLLPLSKNFRRDDKLLSLCKYLLLCKYSNRWNKLLLLLPLYKYLPFYKHFSQWNKLLVLRNEKRSRRRSRAWVEIDLTKVRHNVRQLRSLLEPSTDLMAVVKADAYGHGANHVAKIALAAGASSLAVAIVQEGINLRRDKIKAPILLLGAANGSRQIQLIEKYSLQPSIVSIEQAEQFQKHLIKPISVHIKIDTGMSRLGVSWEEAEKFCEAILQLDKIKIAGIYSHLATDGEPEGQSLKTMELQQQRFLTVTNKLKPLFVNYDQQPLLHLANSSGLMADKRLHYDMVRPGLALYGLCPASYLDSKLDLRPVMSVKARITQIKTVPIGTGVSYNHSFVAKRDTSVAVVGIGYADGVPRRLSNRLEVLLHGQRVPQIGNITMDQLMLDVTDLPNAKLNDVVTLLGASGEQTITADDWAYLLDTISWEILTGFKHRLDKVLPDFYRILPNIIE
jgi:alanine racemase